MHEGGFAASVGANNAHIGFGLNVERGVLYDFSAVSGYCEVFYLYDWLQG